MAAQRVSVSQLQPLVDGGHITGEEIAAKVKAGEIELVDDRQAAASPEPEEEKSVGGFIKNVASSGANLAQQIGGVIAHPVDNLLAPATHMALGGIEKGLQAVGAKNDAITGQPMKTSDIPAFDQFVESMKARYGGAKEIGNTLYHDPVGAAVDASALLGGGAGMAKTAGLEGTARVMRAAAETVDPIRLAGKLAGGVANAAGRTAAPILGKTTGVGTEAIRTAANGSSAFADAMRSGITHADIVDTLKESVQKLADQRRGDYQDQLARIPNDVQMPIQSTQREFLQGLKKFKVNVTAQATPTGMQYGLDFSRSTITDAAEQSKLGEVFGDLESWGKRPGDLSPLGVDTLKQRLSQAVADTRGTRAQAIIANAHDDLRSMLNNKVPGYQELTKNYAEASELLDHVKKEFSVSPTSNPGTTIRKLSYALNQNNEWRKALIDIVDQQTGSHIHDQVAGASMQTLAPRGIAGAIAGGEIAAKAGHIGPSLLLSSPRVVGEALVGLAKARKAINTAKILAQPGVTRTLAFGARHAVVDPTQSSEPEAPQHDQYQ